MFYYGKLQSNIKPLSCSIILGYTKDLSISVVGKFELMHSFPSKVPRLYVSH